MPASSTVTSSQGVDYGAARCIALIEGSYPGPKSYCSKVTLQSGNEPNTAEVIIPLASLDTIVPGVAGVRSSPVEGIKDGDLAVITCQLNPQYQGQEVSNDPEITIMAGTVRSIRRDLKLDKAFLLVKDHRYLLNGLPIVGSWWANIDGNLTADPVSYRQGVKAHFNPSNQPNCIWAAVTVLVNGDEQTEMRPFFCAPFFGIQEFQTTSITENDRLLNQTTANKVDIPSPSENSSEKACYWTPATMWMYFQWVTSQPARDIVLSYGKFQEYASLPDIIEWPNGLENVLSANTTTLRKAFERVYHCHQLWPILVELCKAAGPYAPYMQSNDDGSNTISIVRTRYIGGGNFESPSKDASKGAALYRATGGGASNDMTGPVVVSGHLTTSSDNLYHVVSPVGAHPFIELRWQTPSQNSEEAFPEDCAPLSVTYSTVEASRALEAAYNYQNKDGTYGLTPSLFLPAIFKQYDVCASCQPELGFDFQIGTNQEGFPVARVGRVPLGHLLSSYVSSAVGDTFSRSNSRYPITVETCKDDGKYNWVHAECNVSITGEGVLYFNEWRDQLATEGRESNLEKPGLYWIQKQGKAPEMQVTLVPNLIRLTLAVPCDHRLTAVVDVDGEINLGDMEVDDTDQMNLYYGKRTMAIDTGELFAAEERSTAFYPYPMPQSLKQPPGNFPGANEPYPPAGSEDAASTYLYGDAAVLRDDTRYAYDHANRKLREFGRLDRDADLTMDRIDLTAQPGEMIDTIQNTDASDYPVKGIVSKVVHDFQGSPNQNTKRQLV